MTQGKLFVISGPSGAGKGTICKRLLDADKNMRFSVSMTTRQPREGEVEGVDYFFVDKPAFEMLLQMGGLLEHNQYLDNYYGTPRAQIVKWVEEGNSVILEIDYHGAFQVRDAYPDCVLIFIMPPSIEELEARIAGRGSETEDTKQKRLEEALGEIAQKDKYDYVVINEDLDAAVERVSQIMEFERNKPINMTELGKEE